jgi:hypothetical protein
MHLARISGVTFRRRAGNSKGRPRASWAIAVLAAAALAGCASGSVPLPIAAAATSAAAPDGGLLRSARVRRLPARVHLLTKDPPLRTLRPLGRPRRPLGPRWRPSRTSGQPGRSRIRRGTGSPRSTMCSARTTPRRRRWIPTTSPATSSRPCRLAVVSLAVGQRVLGLLATHRSGGAGSACPSLSDDFGSA